MTDLRSHVFERGVEGAPLWGDWQDQLGRELRESPMPAHAPDHFERIRERMREAAGSDGRPPAPQVRGRARRVPPPAPRRRLGIRFAAAAAVAAAVVAAVAVSWSGVPGIQRSTPAPATAHTVLQRVQRALANLTTISGDVVEYGTARGRPFSHRVGSFTFTSRGDYRIVQRSDNVAYTYDAEKRVAHRYVFRDGQALYSETARDLPDPGPFFSPWMGATQVLDRSVAAYARAVIAELDPDVPVTPVMWEGRTAWSITVPEPLAGGGSDGTARIVVDAQSGYPLAVEHWTSDGDVSGTRIENVKVGGEVPRSRFVLNADVQDKLLPMSERFRRLSLGEAATLGARATSPFTPYRASWVPAGYRLSGVTGAVNGSYLGQYRPIKAEDMASLTVVLTYERGFDRFCIVSRWRSDNPPGSDDPFDENSVALTESTRVDITSGSLIGADARVVLGLPDWPHLYVTTGARHEISVSVAGDLTRAELARIAGSLHPIGD
jgi:outer membrane lipoprotein-sorting protein